MFTGIIENQGRVVLQAVKGAKLHVDLSRKDVFKKGESVAVNGCCLTVVSQKGKTLAFDLSEETCLRTHLHQLKKGEAVNLERAIKASTRLGGHFVLGHVDEVGKIVRVERRPGSLQLEISHSKQLSKYLIDKGSVAVDGVSLTLSLLPKNRFKVFIIPYTEKYTNLNNKIVGDLVNLEADVLGKYVERLIFLNRDVRG